MNDATDIAAAIRRREVTVAETVERTLTTIAKQNQHCHALVDVYEHASRWTAARYDRRLAQTAPAALPPFFGVPIVVKDLNFVRGRRTWMGSRGFGPVWSPIDDRTVASIRRAGFVIVGKSATSELGALPITEPFELPPTRNPLNLALSAGGSSGGAAAAVASRMVPVAQGADAAGSVRIPAAACGLYGFKPTRALLPNPYGLRAEELLYTCGPIGHTARDVAALTWVLSRTRTTPDTPRPRTLRVALATSVQGLMTAQAHVDAVMRVAERFSELGHQVTGEVAMFHDEPAAVRSIYGRLMRDIPIVRPSRLEPYTRWLRLQGRGLSRSKAADARRRIERRIDDWFATDILVCPTTAQAPPPVGSMRRCSPTDMFQQAFEACVFTAPFNLSGQPAATLPVGHPDSPVPVGVQIVGRRGQDALVLHLLESCGELAVR